MPIAGKSILLPQGSLLAGDGANDKGRRYVAAEGIAGVRLLSAGVLRSLPRRDHREAPGVPQPFDLPQLQISGEDAPHWIIPITVFDYVIYLLVFIIIFNPLRE